MGKDVCKDGEEELLQEEVNGCVAIEIVEINLSFCWGTTLHFKGKRQLEIMDGKKKRYVGSGHHRWRSSPQAVITAGGLYRRRSSPLAVFTAGGHHRWRFSPFWGWGGHERIPAYTTRIPRVYRAYTTRIPEKPRVYHAYTARIYTKATVMMLHLF